MTSPRHPVLVLGGTGKTGRRVAARLTGRGVPVRLGSRSGRPPFDWSDRSTWPAAAEGAGAVYLCHAPDLAVPGADEDVAEVTRLAVAAGARRVVLLSGRGEPEAQEAERRVRAAAEEAGAEWAVVRASWFVQNLTEGAFRDAVADGVLALPAGDVAEPFVDVDDVADVAVALLTGEAPAGRVHEVTGPRSLTFAELAAEVTAAGRAVRFEPVPAAAWAAQLRGAGVPAEEVDLLAYLFTTVFDGRNSVPGDGVAAALGRPATDVRVALARAVATGAWDAVPS
ncbi:SDR family oxidoreductase [Blastococcus sp. SYSU D00695]